MFSFLFMFLAGRISRHDDSHSLCYDGVQFGIITLSSLPIIERSVYYNFPIILQVNKGNPPMEIKTGIVDKKVPTASKSKP